MAGEGDRTVSSLVIGADVLYGGPPQHLFAPFELGVERHQCALGQMLVEVCDQAEECGSRAQSASTAAVVDEDERHLVGSIDDRQ